MTMSKPLGPPVKYPYSGNVRWAFLKWADIRSAHFPNHVYLRRLRIFQTPWFALYLHFIFEPDLDRDPHDHPCNFWSLIVRGGYREEVYTNRQRLSMHQHKHWKRWSVHMMPTNWAHQITELIPGTITLCWFGRRTRRWGFWTAKGYVPFEIYTRESDPFGA